MAIQNWINLHYKDKKGEIFVEDLEVGNFLVKNIGAIYLDSHKTSIRTYYKYSVDNLAEAYNAIYIAYRILGYF